MSEFTRIYDLRQLPGTPVHLVASAEERAALARRFGLVAINRLEAEVSLEREGPTARATGRLGADIVQSCAVSGEDLPVRIDEPVALRFVPPGPATTPDEEVELDAEACDEIELSGTGLDLGEAVAQGLSLAIDPFATGPGAEEARRKAGLIDEAASGPFAALGALKKKD